MTRHRILLTGATGFLGSRLAIRLLSRGVDVVCIARAKKGVTAKARVRTALGAAASFETDEAPGRLDILEFDLATESSEVLRDRVRRTGDVDAIWHVGARVDFGRRVEPGSILKENIASTRTMLELRECLDVQRFCYVGTAFQCGVTDKLVAEAPDSGEVVEFRNEYEHSKHRAELLVRRCASVGTATTIFRPGIIVCRPDEPRAHQWNGFYVFVRHVLKLLRGDSSQGDAAAPLVLPGHSDHQIHLVWIDSVVEAMTRLAFDERSIGATYHVSCDDAPTLADLNRAFVEVTGTAGAVFSEDDHVRHAWSRDPFVRDFAPYLAARLRFSTASSAPLLSTLGFKYPAWTPERLRRVLAQAIA